MFHAVNLLQRVFMIIDGENTAILTEVPPVLNLKTVPFIYEH